MGLKERLGKQILFFDGAMGTMLQERGFRREKFRNYGI